MHSHASTPLSDQLAGSRIIPIVENRSQFERVFLLPSANAVWLRNCNLFDLSDYLERSYGHSFELYVNIDHINGIHPDIVGLHFLIDHFHIVNLVSSNPRVLALAKGLGLRTVQRVFAADSAGLESALEAVDPAIVDMLNISPAPIIPYIRSYLLATAPLPVIGSGLLQHAQQVRTVLNAGAFSVATARQELWV
jgi:glycerol uptake operon antiterminator